MRLRYYITNLGKLENYDAYFYADDEFDVATCTKSEFAVSLASINLGTTDERGEFKSFKYDGENSITLIPVSDPTPVNVEGGYLVLQQGTDVFACTKIERSSESMYNAVKRTRFY